MTETGRGKRTSRALDAGDLLPGRLDSLSDALSKRIEAPVRAEYGLPPKDWKVMQVLAAEGALPPTEIHRVNGQNKAQISRALKCLLDRELVAKEPHPEDQRTFVVGLTDSGLAMYREIVRKMRRRQSDFLDALPAREGDRLRELVGSLEKAVEARPGGKGGR